MPLEIIDEIVYLNAESAKVMNTHTLLLINPADLESHYASFAYPPLALLTLAGLTPRDEWSISIVDHNIRASRQVPVPDLVGITVMTLTAKDAYETADEYRKKGIPVVLGGVHVSMVPQEALAHADAVVVGEAENIWKLVLKDAKKGSLQRIYHGDHCDLQQHSVLPDLRYINNKKYIAGVVQTARGCPFSCEFCSVTTYSGTVRRFKPVDHVIQEIQQVPQRFVFISDDNFFGYSAADQARAEELLKAIIRHNIKKLFFTQTGINAAWHPDLLRLAKQAGFFAVFIGFESFLKPVLQGSMQKRINARCVENLYSEEIRNIHQAGIVIFGQHIFGHDEETPTMALKNIDLIAASGIDGIGIAPLIAVPGTRLFERIRADTRLLATPSPDVYNKLFYDITHTTPSILNYDQLVCIRRYIDKRIYAIHLIVIRCLKTFIATRSIIGALGCLQQNLYMKKINRVMIRFNRKQTLENHVPVPGVQ